jgi:hypothetical protein
MQYRKFGKQGETVSIWGLVYCACLVVDGSPKRLIVPKTDEMLIMLTIMA